MINKSKYKFKKIFCINKAKMPFLTTTICNTENNLQASLEVVGDDSSDDTFALS